MRGISMTSKPVIFISSTSDLRSARDLVGKVLYAMGYEPVWQDIEATDGGELIELLRRRLAPCSMVLQLVGKRYGAEPPRPTTQFGRVSYTQFEALEGERLGKKVIYHFLDDNFPTDPAAPEPEELNALQEAYRRRLKDANRLRYSRICSPTDLELSIRRISDELAALRKQAERRSRRLMIVAMVSLFGILSTAALVFVVIHGQKSVTVKFDQMASRLDESEKLIDQFLAERPLDTEGKPIIPQLTGDMLR
jgi:hypothetical protein